jgi:transcriptional regulator with XRE-family HTH domain
MSSQPVERKSVKEWREARGLTQLELAFRTQASLSAIQSLESGRNEPRIGLALAVARALSVGLDDIAWPDYPRPAKKDAPAA